MQAFFNAEVKFGYEAGARMRLKFILSKMVVQNFHFYRESREKCFINLRVMPKYMKYVRIPISQGLKMGEPFLCSSLPLYTAGGR